MKKLIIPNAITILNILSGTLAILISLKIPEKLYFAGILIFIASVFDFLDGFTARLLNAKSEFGKELDSLSDVVSFGLAPTFIMFSLISENTTNEFLPYLAFLIIILSAIRLAIFNTTDQTTEFKGLPTPALALFIAAIPVSAKFSSNLIHINIINVYQSLAFLVSTTIIFSALLISPLKMFSLKFKNFKFKENKLRFIFLITSIFLMIFLLWQAIPLIILTYILFSIFLIKKI